MRTFYIAAMLLFVFGCSSTRVIEKVRVDTIKAVSPTIDEVLEAKTTTDTVIITNKIIERDTVIDVRYYPIKKKFYLKVKPDTVTITRLDTVTLSIEKNNSGGYIWIAVISLAIIALIILIVIKK